MVRLYEKKRASAELSRLDHLKELLKRQAADVVAGLARHRRVKHRRQVSVGQRFAPQTRAAARGQVKRGAKGEPRGVRQALGELAEVRPQRVPPREQLRRRRHLTQVFTSLTLELIMEVKLEWRQNKRKFGYNST